MNSESASETLQKAVDSGVLEAALVIGQDAEGNIQIFTDQADRPNMVVLLERAKNSLVRSLD